VGNEKTTTISELAETIVKVSGKRIEIRYDKSKPVGPLSRIPSTSKARQILGWSSTSSLADGIRKTFDWMKQRLIGDDKLTS
jgi:GDP-D-mannose 3',5'-epimerase